MRNYVRHPHFSRVVVKRFSPPRKKVDRPLKSIVARFLREHAMGINPLLAKEYDGDEDDD